MKASYRAEFKAFGQETVPNPSPVVKNRVTIEDMLLEVFAMRLLEVMFFVGLAGSAVVVIISFVEDGKELFGKD
jgi:hypothetical protein